jgi:hypothetical protein
LGILLGAAIQFQQSHTTLNPINPESATTFVASGLYRYTALVVRRHPPLDL